ncbi:hypothetical protein MTO98_16170 [Mucilaginibacter sp. SMC90]|uniref:hypothetical protein n=1 Tax=Mucilaginibacter sp. SMC90 TaxID=2929803 RepID=UPI001FB23B1B|nr:hypothetical protein [Mucilaginibacter sp. SMC90]UOE52614.1 hypothetical protein MTO98_16170 [Mucilaginibacter sp. SMC90]
MIEQLSLEKLAEYGFTSEDIENFRRWENFELMFHKTTQQRYWASNKEHKIYSGADASRKLYFKSQEQFRFPDDELSLIPEYFSLKRNKFLEERQLRAGLVYDDGSAKERFMEDENEWAESQLATAKKQSQGNDVVAKLAAKKHKENMEVYADWLKRYEEPVVEPILQPSMMKYVREITSKEYSHGHIHDDELMLHYEASLKKVNTELSLNTTIYQLPDIFKIRERWQYQLSERLQNAPSAELATEAFKKELLESLIYHEKAASNDPSNEGLYYNRYRKITYDQAVKGLVYTLKDLGYLMLKYQVGRPEGVEVIQSIMPVFGLDTLLIVLAEGVGIALFVHGSANNQSSNDSPKPVLFKPEHDAADYLALLRNPDYPILNELGEYIYGDKKKSAITAFFDVLDNRGIVYHYSAKKRAPLINELIPGLKISARVLDTYPDLYSQMKPYFEKLINDFLR